MQFAYRCLIFNISQTSVCPFHVTDSRPYSRHSSPLHLSYPSITMGMVLYPPEKYLSEWAAANELTAARFAARLDESARGNVAITPGKLARLNAHCTLGREPRLTEASFTALLDALGLFPAPAGPPILTRAAPLLYRALSYLARYPFERQPPAAASPDASLTRRGLARAVLIVHPDRAYRFFGGEGGSWTRAHAGRSSPAAVPGPGGADGGGRPAGV
jgi:hypothetical protein